MELGKFNKARVDAIMPQGYYLELETGGRVLLPGNDSFELQEPESISIGTRRNHRRLCLHGLRG